MRETYDEQQAASRLRVSVAAWRWAAASGAVPAADAGPGLWSRAVVESTDAEAVRAALPGPAGAWWAAERLTEALGAPLPRCRPRVTPAAIGHLVRAGLLVHLGGDPAYPDVHPDQVAALARRRDLPALLDRHVPLGPDQAAVRLGVRRIDFDHVVRLGWITPTGTVEIDYKRHGGVTTVPLYSAEDVALLPLTRPTVDWHALRTVPAGRRSPLAALTPTDPDHDTVLLVEVARIAGVGRAAVVNWRRRHPDFPAPAGGDDVHPTFARSAVVAWLLDHDKIAVPSTVPTATLHLRPTGAPTRRFQLEDPWIELSDDPEGEDRLTGWMADDDTADTLAVLAAADASVSRLTAPGTDPLALPGGARVIDRFRPGSGGLRVTLAWPSHLRGHAARTHTGGLLRHALPYTAPGTDCRCAQQACGGIIPTPYCPDHGHTAEPALEWHPAGGIRCTHLTRPAVTPA
ncbi:hypothetical protein [Streptomyces roseolus]|uniref:hypothetical protein n=1 Tax=Streptomyces roseolus TaxID=67358 RepID=UPI001672E0C4|nr:hypothetical protein [Streptomyces roseolus]GGR67557.1 hypothetical protein GCM10010282_70560 [Streptomyces roseolus]